MQVTKVITSVYLRLADNSCAKVSDLPMETLMNCGVKYAAKKLFERASGALWRHNQFGNLPVGSLTAREVEMEIHEVSGTVNYEVDSPQGRTFHVHHFLISDSVYNGYNGALFACFSGESVEATYDEQIAKLAK